VKASSTIFTLLLIVALMSTLSAQVDWEKYENNPVLVAGSSGEWDDDNVVAPCVIKVGETYHMWYDGNFDNSGTMNNGIGHATSSDGIDWSKDILNPVLLPTAGSWDLAGVTQATVLFDDMDSLYHMWYGGWSSLNDGFIGHATSSDAGHWIKDTINNPVLSPGPAGSWDDFALIAVCVIKVDDTYHMWYDGWQDGSASTLKRIGHATSADGIIWEKDANNPVLIPGNSGSWDYNWVRAGKVVFDGSIFHMWYTGGTWFNYDFGYAISSDGTSWTKYNDSTTTNQLYADSDPVMKRGLIGSWDSWSIFSCSVMFNESEDTLKMWYSGSDNDLINTRIGYATSPKVADGINDSHYDFPKGFALSQNYPNPFNPTTTIEFDLPKTSDVIIDVYNIAGQKIQTLLNEKMVAGNHQVDFNAENLSSGVYFYRIEAGEFVDVKKMILIK
jgi:hypothetical protein